MFVTLVDASSNKHARGDSDKAFAIGIYLHVGPWIWLDHSLSCVLRLTEGQTVGSIE